MDRTRRIGAGAAAVLLAVAGATIVVAPPALAKAGAQVQVSTHHARVGASVRVTAFGGDDDPQPQQVCVQLASHGHWRSLRCSRVSQEPSQVTAVLRERHTGRVHVRSALVDVSGHGRQRHVGATDSATVTFVH